MKKYLLFMVIIVMTLLIQVGAASAQELDPLAVMEAYDIALQAGDIEGALAMFADDAVLTTRQGQFVGKEQIRAWLERLVAQNDRIEVAGRQAEGPKVSWQNKFFRADLPALVNEPLEAQAEAEVEAGQIKTFSSILTDASQAKLDAAMAAQTTAAPTSVPETTAQESPAPAQLPSTGGSRASELWSALALAVVGILLIGFGLVKQATIGGF